jgi:predicted phosphoribosyltransferase
MTHHFFSRKQAGQKLAKALSPYKEKDNTVVLALPRGGVPVASEVARELHLPLDLMLVRKLGVPGHEELAMGAIANGNIQAINEDVVRSYGISESAIQQEITRQHEELRRHNKIYRADMPARDLKHCTVILIDDGIATGANMYAAIQTAKKQHAKKIIVAVPVSSAEAYAFLEEEADEMISLHVPEPFYGVGAHYADFSQLKDEEVVLLLQEAASGNSDSKKIGQTACERA